LYSNPVFFLKTFQYLSGGQCSPKPKHKPDIVVIAQRQMLIKCRDAAREQAGKPEPVHWLP